MVQIVATDDLAKQIEKAEGVVELVDSNGTRLGTLTRPPTKEDVRIAKEDVRIAKERLAANRPGLTTDDLVKRISSIKPE